jgi:lipopolysaccharide export LptBFGC system permease protein LptF
MAISFESYERLALIILFFLVMTILIVLNGRIMRKLRNGHSIFSIAPFFRFFALPEVYVFVLLTAVLASLAFTIGKLTH